MILAVHPHVALLHASDLGLRFGLEARDEVVPYPVVFIIVILFERGVDDLCDFAWNGNRAAHAASADLYDTHTHACTHAPSSPWLIGGVPLS